MSHDQATQRWATLLHLSVLTGWVMSWARIIIPIAIWQIKKRQLSELDDHGKNAVNWIISRFIYTVILTFSIFIFAGIPLFVIQLFYTFSILFPVIAAIKAYCGETWEYPLSIKFIK